MLDEEEVDFDEIDNLFGPSKTITDIDPDRELFHFSEFDQYYHNLGVFEAKRRNHNAAEAALDMLLEYFDETEDEIKHLAKALAIIFIERKFKPFEHKKLEDCFSTYVLPQTEDKPKLNHDLLYNLYCKTEHVTKQLIYQLIEIGNDDSILDTDFYTFLLGVIIDLGLVELIPEVEILYDKNWINPKIFGNFDEVVDEINLLRKISRF